MNHTNKNILVIGASGFIGQHLCQKLIQSNDVALTTLARNKSSEVRYEQNKIETAIANLSSQRSIENAIEGIDIVINLAHDFKKSAQENIRNFNNLTQACVAKKIKHFIHISSVAAYDDWPHGDLSEDSPSTISGSDYKQAKVTMEQSLETLSATGSLPSTIIQPTIVYGPYSWLWTDHIVEKLLTGKLLLPKDCSGLCHAVYVGDVVDALILATNITKPRGEKYLISGPSAITWQEFYQYHNQLLGQNSIEYIDIDAPEKQTSNLKDKILGSINPSTIVNWPLSRLILSWIQRAH
jgi:nucleoside-diphosphate-sugar epimerase